MSPANKNKSTNATPKPSDAALGAVGVVLFGWAWLSRIWGVSVTFCAVAAVGWLYFFAQSF